MNAPNLTKMRKRFKILLIVTSLLAGLLISNTVSQFTFDHSKTDQSKSIQHPKVEAPKAKAPVGPPTVKNGASINLSKLGQEIQAQFSKYSGIQGVANLFIPFSDYTFTLKESDVFTDPSLKNQLINERKVLTYSIEDFHESVDKARINATQVKLKFAPDGTGKQDRINFSILADKIRIKQDTIDVTLNKFELDGYALLHDKEDKLDLHIPSQGAVQQIVKAFLRL